jgi:hypothetical protein
MLYKQFHQGIGLVIGSMTSAAILSYIMKDVYRIEKNKLKNNYEKEIKVLKNEIEKLKQERTKI